MHQLKNNIWKNYIWNFFFLFIIFEPVLYVYFMEELSFTLTQVMISISFFLFLLAIFEIPTGVVGDKLGYKKTLILGGVSYVLGAIGYLLSQNFYHVLIAEVFWGLGTALQSGSWEGFIYDTLKNLKKVKDYKKVLGRSYAFFWTGLAISSLLGGFIANINLKWVILIGFIPLIIPPIIAATFVEPKRIKKKSTHLEHIGESFKRVISKKKLLYYAVNFVILLLVIDTAFHFFQPLLKSLELNYIVFGVLFSIGYIVSGIGSILGHFVEKYLGEKKILFLMYIVIFFSLILMGISFTPTVLLALLLILIIIGLQAPIITDYINHHIQSHNRATVNSIINLTRTMVVAIFTPILGYLADIWSMQTVFFIEAGFIFIAFIIIMIWRKRIKL